MSELNDRIISELKSRQNLIDKRYGDGSTEDLIDLSTALSSLYDERRRIVFNQRLSKEEKIKGLLDIRRRIKKVGVEFS